MMYAIIVSYKDGTKEYFSNCNMAAKKWGCSNQGVINMLRHCESRTPEKALIASSIARKNNISYIKKVDNIDDLKTAISAENDTTILE